ncbi:MAG: tetratricopeptide repeat protein [Saprospiraceae bacterium]|nr:tetratricopeptide repeat protein [Pyrinomonadaceae bacterium]
MKKILGSNKSFLAWAVTFAILMSGVPATAQDLVPVSDITGGSSVFIFRNSAKAAPRRFVSKVKQGRTKTQRLESARKVSKQYVALAKVAPRRTRTATIDPYDPRLKKIPSMPAEEGATLFAGVGEYYMDRDDYNRAIDFFREASTMDKKNTRASLGLSEALALKGNELLVSDNVDFAKAIFEDALKYNPKNAPAFFGLGELYSGKNQESEAVKNYELALANDSALTEIYVPLGVLYYQQGEIAKADTLLTKALAVSPDDAQTQYFLGLIRYTQNRNQDALTAFTKAKSADPKYAEAFYQSGETLTRLNNSRDAVADYKQATILKPAYFEAWLGLGSANYELGNYAEALIAYKEAVRLKNNNAEAFENLADANRQLNNYNDAESAYNLANIFIVKNADYNKQDAADIYSKAAFMIAKQCEIDKRRGAPCRWETAISHLEKATVLSQNSVDYANLGWAYYNWARQDIDRKYNDAAKPKLLKAKENLQKAAASNPKFIEGPLLNLGMALTDMGDYAGAVEALTRVVQKEPKWAFALNELGLAYRKQNKLKEAAEQFKKAVGKDEKFAAAYYNWGEAEFRNGNVGETKKAYQKLKKMGQATLAQRLDLETGGAVSK